MKNALRLVIYIIGLGILSLGVVLNIKTGLGVSAISSVPYVISNITGMSMGTITIFVYCVYILVQIILIGKNFKWLILLQLPCSLLFGKYTDLFVKIIQIQPTSIVMSYVLLAFAILFTAVGVVLTVGMKIVPNAPDGLVQEIAIKAKIKFGLAKNLFDILSVVISVAISLLVTQRIIGIGVGTVLSAILIGRTIAFLNGVMKDRLAVLL